MFWHVINNMHTYKGVADSTVHKIIKSDRHHNYSKSSIFITNTDFYKIFPHRNTCMLIL